VRIGELSDQGGVAVATIKYYLREGLLPAGARTGPNQASYTDAHLRRLRLIRALVDVGGLSIAAVKDVLAAVDEGGESVRDVLGSLLPTGNGGLGEVAEFLVRRGYACDLDHPAVRSLASILVTARELGHDRFADRLDAYGDACERIADVASDAESVVVDTVLGDAALVALRRIASATRAADARPGRTHP